MTLRYAPFLLDFESLNNLELLLKDCRRIEKNTASNFADKLAESRALMQEAYRLWDHIECHPHCRQDGLRKKIGGDQDKWRAIVETWQKMGLLHREPEDTSYRLSLRTRMGQIVAAKCPFCGNVVEAPKAMFLELTACPDCMNKVLFVILAPPVLKETKV
jgi:hypothetical protein